MWAFCPLTKQSIRSGPQEKAAGANAKMPPTSSQWLQRELPYHMRHMCLSIPMSAEILTPGVLSRCMMHIRIQSYQNRFLGSSSGSDWSCGRGR